MAHTFTSLHYHLVFGTLGRRNLIPQDLFGRICAYMGGIVNNIGGLPIAIGGTTDHVHLLITLPGAIAPADAVCKIKANLTKWAHETFPTMSDFAWQEGYGAFSVSRSNVDAVATYIGDQPRHHRSMTFESEFAALLEKHGVAHQQASTED